VDKALDRSKSTRRDLLKLAGAAAIGAAGASALGATKVRAAGSGATIGAFFNPLHIASGHLAPHAEVVIGPFPYPGSTVFTSANYIGIVGNLTAKNWKGAGWMSVRSTDFPFDLLTRASTSTSAARRGRGRTGSSVSSGSPLSRRRTSSATASSSSATARRPPTMWWTFTAS